MYNPSGIIKYLLYDLGQRQYLPARHGELEQRIRRLDGFSSHVAKPVLQRLDSTAPILVLGCGIFLKKFEKVTEKPGPTALINEGVKENP